MSWLAGTLIVAIATAGIAELDGLRHALERGDTDEVTRLGVIAGPAVVDRALAPGDRVAQLAGIVAAPVVGQREQLLPSLARVAAGADRRTAIPAARAARMIADALASTEPADDVAAEDLAAWRALWLALARRGDRFIEVRTDALAIASDLARSTGAIGRDALGFELTTELADPDPAMRATALALVPQPAPVELRGAITAAISNDADPRVVLAAAQALCADLVTDDPVPVLAAIGPAGLARIQTIATTLPGGTKADVGALRDATRCLSAAKPSLRK
jgi:hypothetical protein